MVGSHVQIVSLSYELICKTVRTSAISYIGQDYIYKTKVNHCKGAWILIILFWSVLLIVEITEVTNLFLIRSKVF